jgi:hypothetical protein
MADSGVRFWEGRWRPFLLKHADWWDRFGPRGPVYALPAAVVAELAAARPSSDEGHRAQKPLIDRGEAEAEADFSAMCSWYDVAAVGVRGEDGEAIIYMPWAEPPLAELEERNRAAPNPLSPEGLREADGYASPSRHQARGYVGKLLYDKDFQQFRDERDLLKAHWSRLVPHPAIQLHKLSFSLLNPSQPQALVEPYLGVPRSDQERVFRRDLWAFLLKWGLIRWVTWDLPEPQGPWASVPAGTAAFLLGDDQPVSHYPNYYNIPTDPDMRSRQRDQQSRAARAAGIEPPFPVEGISPQGDDPSGYESAFRLGLFERAVRERYGAPRGLVDRLARAFSKTYDLSKDRIRQIRSLYAHTLPDGGMQAGSSADD